MTKNVKFHDQADDSLKRIGLHQKQKCKSSKNNISCFINLQNELSRPQWDGTTGTATTGTSGVDSVAQLVFSDVWSPAVMVHSESHTAVLQVQPCEAHRQRSVSAS